MHARIGIGRLTTTPGQEAAVDTHVFTCTRVAAIDAWCGRGVVAAAEIIIVNAAM
jgi:hypothetical protein